MGYQGGGVGGRIGVMKGGGGGPGVNGAGLNRAEIQSVTKRAADGRKKRKRKAKRRRGREFPLLSPVFVDLGGRAGDGGV